MTAGKLGMHAVITGLLAMGTFVPAAHGDQSTSNEQVEQAIEVMRAQGMSEEQISKVRELAARPVQPQAEPAEPDQTLTDMETTSVQPTVTTAPASPVKSGATVEYDDAIYDLQAHGSCATGDEGAYNIWFVTPDEDEPSVAKQGAPRLHAFSDGNWSRLEFSGDTSASKVSIYREGQERLSLTDGQLSYAGPAGDGADKTISIDLQC